MARTLEFYSRDSRTCPMSWPVFDELLFATGLSLENIFLALILMRRANLLLIRGNGLNDVRLEFLPEFWTFQALFEINVDDLDELLEAA